MTRILGAFRLIPVVLFATTSLLALKTVGLLTEGGYVLARPGVAQAQEAPAAPAPSGRSWAQDVLGYPDITGSIPSKSEDKKGDAESKGDAKAEPAPSKPAPTNPKPEPDGTPVQLDAARPMSPAERAILERLQERREELDKRARELDLRENLIKAADKRLEGRIAELKQIEASINAAIKKRDEAQAAQFKGIVSMYENMKPKDAAKIFDRLDLRVLLEVASQINPRKMSDILAQMAPEAAERLTVELASRAQHSDERRPAADLPKIEGRTGG